MTEHKTMNTVAHAAFRRDLARFDAALAAFPDGSYSRADQLKRAWDHFATELHHHHDYEEQFFWPALQQVAPDLPMVDELDAEHGAMREALERADAAMTALHANPTDEQVSHARAAHAGLSQVLLDHLAHEERDLEPISAQYFSSEPMQAALKKVMKAHRGRLGNVLAWLQDGADADSRRFLRTEIPAPIVYLVSTFAGRRYQREIAATWR